MTSYTELLRENQLRDVDCSGDNKIWRIVTPRLLYKNGENKPYSYYHCLSQTSLQLKSNTVGTYTMHLWYWNLEVILCAGKKKKKL